MKPSVLEALTEEAIKRIENNVDLLLSNAGIKFEEDDAPVRRSVHKLQTVERIDKKLAALVGPVEKSTPEAPAEVPAEQADEQAEAPTPDERPAKSKKSK